MAETQTPNFHWTKPDLGGDASTWGNVLNTTIDAVDAVAWANQQAGVPIGSITMFAATTPPANWLICDGSTLDYGATPAYQGLFNIIGRTFNPALTGTQFALPNLVQKFPIGAGANVLGAVGGAPTVTLDATMIPAHSHPIQQPSAHTHAATASEASHTHSMADHTHTVNQVFGGGSDMQSGSGWGQRNQAGGAMTSIPNVGFTAAAVSVSVSPALANIPGTTDNTGGGLSHNNMPPFIAINFIIRYV